MYLTLVITNAAAASISPAASASSSSTSILAASSSSSARTSNSLLHATFFHHSPASNSRRRKRLSKRHSDGYDPNDLNENSTTLEWVNTCGGYYDPTPITNKRPKRKHPKKIYKDLKVNAYHYFQDFNNNHQAIDIDNFEMWSKHMGTYKFLPKLKRNSKINLRRWYKNMQTYVASFAYLRRIQLKWDHSKAQSKSDIAEELNNLLFSSRSMLCALETAVNQTNVHHGDKRKLNQVTRQQMNKRLKLHTREMAVHNPGVLQEPNSIDLKFVKYYYYEFLENMFELLKKFTKCNWPKGNVLPKMCESKAFNEVEKPTSTLRGSKQRQFRKRKAKLT